MKKSVKLLGVLLTVLLFSGCMKSNVEMKINSDKSMDYTMTMGIAKSVKDLAQNSGSEQEEQVDVSSLFSDEDKKEAEKQGFIINNYEDDTFTGYKITKKFTNIDDLSSESNVSSDINITKEETKPIFTIKKGFFKNTYIAKFDYSGAKDSTSSIGEYKDNEEYAEYFKDLDVSFNVELPSNAVSNNATSVDGKKLKWDLTKFDKDNIEFSFEMMNTMNIIITVAIGVAVLAIIGVIVFIIIKKKNN